MTLSARGISLALLVLPMGGALQAQAIKNEPSKRHFSESEIAAIAMPALAFEPTSEDIANYDKYFFFRRADTPFDDAYADIAECDALTSGLSYYEDNSRLAEAQTQQAVMQYGLAGGVGGAIGGVIGSAVADAIGGSAVRRAQRRINMRICMHFKGYDRFGLSKDLWQEFNFEEGFERTDEPERSRKLLMQARVASGALPQQEILQP